MFEQFWVKLAVQMCPVYPESSEVGGVVADASQDAAWSVLFEAAGGAPVLQTVVPKHAGEVVQQRDV